MERYLEGFSKFYFSCGGSSIGKVVVVVQVIQLRPNREIQIKKQKTLNPVLGFPLTSLWRKGKFHMRFILLQCRCFLSLVSILSGWMRAVKSYSRYPHYGIAYSSSSSSCWIAINLVNLELIFELTTTQVHLKPSERIDPRLQRIIIVSRCRNRHMRFLFLAQLMQSKLNQSQTDLDL